MTLKYTMKLLFMQFSPASLSSQCQQEKEISPVRYGNDRHIVSIQFGMAEASQVRTYDCMNVCL